MVMTSEFSTSANGVCGIYTRISLDAYGEGLGVERQRVDGMKVAQTNGLEVYRVYSDNSKSAFRRKVKRPGFEALMSDIEQGRINVVVVWKVDRMTRQPMDLERLIEFSETRGLRIITWDSKYDLSIRSDRLRLRLEAMVAADQSEAQSDRVKRKHAELRAAGKSVGGRRLFGYETDGVTRREVEVDVVREMAARVLEGESLRSIAFDLNKRGFRTAFRDGLWSSAGIRRLVAHRRHTKGDPPVFDEETHVRLSQLVHDPARRTSNRGVAGKYFLRGMVRCGNCDSPMKGHPQGDRVHYACVTEPTRKACGTVARMVEPVDALVTEYVLGVLERAVLTPVAQDGALSEVDQVRDEIRRFEVKIAGLERQWDDDMLSDEQFGRMNKNANDKLDKARQRLAVLQQDVSLPEEFVRADIRTHWETLDVEKRRQALAGIIEKVVIHPQGRGYRRPFSPGDQWPQFDPTKVEIIPKQDRSAAA